MVKKTGDKSRNKIGGILETSDEIYRTMIENMSDYVTLVDLAGRYIYASPLHRQLGYKPEDLVGKSPMDFIPMADKLRLTSMLLGFAKRIVISRASTIAKIKREIAAVRISTQFRDKFGKWHFVEAVPGLVENPRGGGYALILITRDVTERRQAEIELRKSEDRYRCIVQSAKDIILTLSPTYAIYSVNPAFETITGWLCSEWLGKTFNSIIHMKDIPQAEKVCKAVMNGRSVPAFELRVLSRSGAFLMLEFTATPIVQEGKITGALYIARDITRRKESQDAMRAMNESLKSRIQFLERSQQAKGMSR